MTDAPPPPADVPDGDGRYYLTIHDMPSGERPRERLQNYGAEALSTAELIAILLRTGLKGENVLALSTRLLTMYGGLPGLARATFNELATIKGVGPAKTCQLKAALELGRRLVAAAPNQRPRITSPADAANLLMPEMSLLEQEHLRLLLLDTKNGVIASPTVYIGNVNTAVIRVGELFKQAVREHCTALIVAHNHPSGDPTPSPEDVQMTRRIVEAGRLLDIEVLDHLIIGHGRYISLKQRGLGF
ncbi:MAG: JAB domain-containing protein [Caldilineae bacterium]|nr:MAG: JAB domain-containing protein [Caldilineae bacterium]